MLYLKKSLWLIFIFALSSGMYQSGALATGNIVGGNIVNVEERGDAQAPADMVLVPAGPFIMGSDPNVGLDHCRQLYNEPDACARSWFINESPRHTVTLAAFYIDTYEVTNAQFATFLNAEGNQREVETLWFDSQDEHGLIEQQGGPFRPKIGYDDHPVVEVTWYGAKAYCSWVDKRLPSEAEWEKAARGTDGRQYPWGDAFEQGRANFCDAACQENRPNQNYYDGYEETAPVGSYEEGISPYGAYDMAGNVWEWTHSVYENYPYQVEDGREDTHRAEVWYVERGGSWLNVGFTLRSSFRSRLHPTEAHGNVGFRCARSGPTTRPERYHPTSTPTPTPSAANSEDAADRSFGSQLEDSPAMVFVPAGPFIMGSDPDIGIAYCRKFFSYPDNCLYDSFKNESPVHSLNLQAFYIDTYEVTNAQFAAFLNEKGNQREPPQLELWLDIDDKGSLIEFHYAAEGPHHDSGLRGWFRPKAGVEDHPVVEVTWYGAKAYCEWLDKRLPTEAEWEKAARGTDERQYPWGNEFDGIRGNFCDKNCAYDHRHQHDNDGYEQTAPVGSYERGVSPYGVHDMAGNVWEWTSTIWGTNWKLDYPYPYRAGDGREDLDKTGVQRVMRGGAWYSDEDTLRTPYRQSLPSSSSFNVVGFRCVRSETVEKVIETVTSDDDDLELTATLKFPPTPTPQPTLTATATPFVSKAFIDMVFVSAGAFIMGSDLDTSFLECQLLEIYFSVEGTCERWWYEDEVPPHYVTLDDFYIDTYEVTNAQFATFLNAQTEVKAGWLDLEQSLLEQQTRLFQPQAGYADHPVVGVTWYGAQAYCESQDKRLPTEAEWEKAARGTDGELYPWGNYFDGPRANFCDANCNGMMPMRIYNDGYEETAPVGSYESGISPYGAYDMAGNVSEWTNSMGWRYPYQADDGRENTDANFPRVVRGGAWNHLPVSLRTSDRFIPLDAAFNHTGFRCARSVTE